MTLISNRNILPGIWLGCIWVALCVPLSVGAQNSVALSVAPTLVELGTQPGELWQSSVRVINSNSFPLTVYGLLVNFRPQGERGQGEFIPVVPSETNGATLAEWITLPEATVTIAPGASGNIPFTVAVPSDAAPGSHFAALQVSTQPLNAAPGQPGLQTAQIVSSLFFIRVSGDINEVATIRSFTADNSLTAVPSTDIVLRFENKGNVHLQPQGDIRIKNMWGAERGRIPVNFNTSFGNALPDTIRRYEFSWQGTPSFFDIGRYSAEATLAYGQEGRQFVTQKTHFWVIPLAAILVTLGVLLSIGLFLFWMVRSYVERMFALAGIDPATIKYRARATAHPAQKSPRPISIKNAAAPFFVGYTDLLRHLRQGALFHRQGTELWLFVKSYRLFIISIIGSIFVVIFFITLVTFLRSDGIAYLATVGSAENAIVYDSEELAYIELTGQVLPTSWPEDSLPVRIVNASGEVGLAASLAMKIPADYIVVGITTNPKTRSTSVITFSPEDQVAALALSAALGDVLLSADPSATELTLIVGSR